MISQKKGKIMLNNNDYYHPDEALSRISEQEAMLKTAMDIQVVLQLLISKELVTQEEIANMRLKVVNLPTYKTTLDSLKSERVTMEKAKANPEDYLKALFNAKVNGDIK